MPIRSRPKKNEPVYNYNVAKQPDTLLKGISPRLFGVLPKKTSLSLSLPLLSSPKQDLPPRFNRDFLHWNSLRSLSVSDNSSHFVFSRCLFSIRSFHFSFYLIQHIWDFLLSANICDYFIHGKIWEIHPNLRKDKTDERDSNSRLCPIAGGKFLIPGNDGSESLKLYFFKII